MKNSSVPYRFKPEVTSPIDGVTSCLLLFNNRFLSNMHHSKLAARISFVHNDRMSISVAAGIPDWR
jgi:hypothetical protein